MLNSCSIIGPTWPLQYQCRTIPCHWTCVDLYAYQHEDSPQVLWYCSSWTSQRSCRNHDRWRLQFKWKIGRRTSTRQTIVRLIGHKDYVSSVALFHSGEQLNVPQSDCAIIRVCDVQLLKLRGVMNGWRMHWAVQRILGPEGEHLFQTPISESILTNEEYFHHRRVLEDKVFHKDQWWSAESRCREKWQEGAPWGSFLS